MYYLLFFLGCFVVIFLLYLISVILRTSKYDKYKNGKQVQFFVKKYGLKFKNISMRKFLVLLSIVNSILMALTVTIIFSIDNIVIKFLLAFVLLIVLLLIFYSLLGMYIRKKEK